MSGTVKNKVDLTTQAETDIADNTTQEISAEDERSMFLNIIESYLNIKDGGLVVQSQTGYSSAITPSSDYAFSTKKYVDDSLSGIDLSTLWNKSGNTLASRGVFGSTSGAYGWDWKVDNVTVGWVADDETIHLKNVFIEPVGGDSYVDLFPASPGSYFFGRFNTDLYFYSADNIVLDSASSFTRFKTGSTTRLQIDSDGKVIFGVDTGTAFTSTYFSIKSAGNDSTTYNSQWKNADATVLGWLKDNGDFFTKTAGFGGTGNDTGVDLVVFTGQTNDNTKNAFRVRNSDYTTISLWRNDGVAFVKNLCVNTSVGNGDDFNNTAAIFYAPNTDTGSSNAGWFRKADYNTILKLLDNGNIGVGGTSFGSGAGVMFIANAGTDASSNPTGGFIFASKSGTIQGRTSSGALNTILGDYQQKSANYTAVVTDETIECTANTFTVTLYTAAGNTGRTLIINNQGSGVITVDANSTETINGSLTQTLNQYDSITIVSNGTNWIII